MTARTVSVAPPPDAIPEPAIPFVPFERGELLEAAVGSGHVREEDLPAGTRAELDALRASRAGARPADPADALPVAERARRMLAARLAVLDRKAGDSGDPDQLAALRELARIAGGQTEAAAQQRPVADVLRDMAEVLRSHGYGVTEPRA